MTRYVPTVVGVNDDEVALPPPVSGLVDVNAGGPTHVGLFGP